MNYRYNLDQTQARPVATLKKGDQWVMVVPLKEQYDAYKVHSIKGDYVLFEPTDYKGAILLSVKLPFPLNARVGLRETWNLMGDSRVTTIQPMRSTYIYKANYKFPNFPADIDKWRPPSSMPTEAIRHWFKPTEVRVDRVQDMTYDEIELAGFDIIFNEYHQPVDSTFRQWFNKRYSTPRPVKENGEVARYEAYAWDRMSFIEFNKLDVNRNYEIAYEPPDYTEVNWDGIGYKHKPLTIHIDPYVAIYTGEIE